MDTEKLKLTSSEIGSLWGEYVNGTAVDVVNRYMYSIIEDEAIKAIFNDALKTFEKQKTQIITFFENEGFPVPIGFNESDLYLGKQRLFSDAFCLNYLHIMTLHGLLGHITTLSISVRKDLRDFYDSCDNDAKKMFHQTIELLLDKGLFQRDPLYYADEHPQFISSNDFKFTFLYTNNDAILPLQFYRVSLFSSQNSYEYWGSCLLNNLKIKKSPIKKHQQLNRTDVF